MKLKSYVKKNVIPEVMLWVTVLYNDDDDAHNGDDDYYNLDDSNDNDGHDE